MADTNWTTVTLGVLTALGGLGTLTGGRVAFVESGRAEVAEQTQVQQVDAIARFEETHVCVTKPKGEFCEATITACRPL